MGIWRLLDIGASIEKTRAFSLTSAVFLVRLSSPSNGFLKISDLGSGACYSFYFPYIGFQCNF